MEIKQYVIGLLTDYNSIKQEMDSLQFELKNLEISSDTEMIEAMTFSPPQGERVATGKISDKTSGIALTYAERFLEIREQAAHEVNARLWWLTATINRLDYYMDRLPAHQAAVLRNYYFDGYSWREIESLTGVSYKTLAHHKNSAIKALVQSYSLLEKLGVLDASNKTPTLLQ